MLIGVCHAVRRGIEGKGLLGIEFDRVKQYMSASQFSSQTGGEDLASPPQLQLEIKVIYFISLARVALEKFLWQLGLCTIQE